MEAADKLHAWQSTIQKQQTGHNDVINDLIRFLQLFPSSVIPILLAVCFMKCGY